ncbi:hypothetical protein [Geothrix sp. PMB-07]|uniref:hypothetical protein n=1 Tax=Geothrix sp. PMB-07 TaxID=3068640 RepID=UPI002741CE7D|nr:hypothetical protein [Geothrix sp. PMB-07]WLT31124.1 hypothetical protein Q9293_15515 [Geothrix sp. PMB-07]
MSANPKKKPATKKKPAGVVKKSSAVNSSFKASVCFPVKKNPEEQASADALAEFAINPCISSALTVKTFTPDFSTGEVDLGSLVTGLSKSIGRVQGGDLKECEAMLIGQAHSLQAIFQTLASRAAMNIGHYPSAVDSYLRLALRAQSQCRATLETLAAVKNPPVIFARQANIANGPQQVNNGTMSAPAGKVEEVRNELMEAQDAERVD